jgi:DnaD/phage-associated family protein
MKLFPGFSKNDGGKTTSIPSEFFEKLMPIIDDLHELKVILFAIWFLEQQEGKTKYMRFTNFTDNHHFMAGLGNSDESALENLQRGLELAIKRNVILVAPTEENNLTTAVFFMNSPRGRAAIKAIQDGAWNMDDLPLPVQTPSRPNIYQLYEANIGPLTPMIAETLQDAEDSYPLYWIEQAIRIAVENNVRRWRYVEAILESWKERGRDEKDRRDTQEDAKRFLDGEFGQFFKTG